MFNSFVNKSYVTSTEIEELLRSSIDKYDECIWIKNINGKYLYVNNSFCDVIGREKEYLLENNCKEIFDRRCYKIDIENDRVVIKNKKYSIINKYLCINGKECLLHVHKIPIIDSNDKCVSLIAIAKQLDSNKLNDEKYLDYGDFTAIITENRDKINLNNYNDILGYIEEINDDESVFGVSVWILKDKSKLKKMVGVGVLDKFLYDYEVNLSRHDIHYLKSINSDLLLPKYEEMIADFYRKNKLYKIYDKLFKGTDKLIIPILVDNNLFGIINLFCNMENYTKKTEKYLKSVASRIAYRIQNIELSKVIAEQFSKKVRIENDLNIFLKLSTDLCILIDLKGNIKKVSSNAIELLGWGKEELSKMTIDNIIELTEQSIDLNEIYTNHSHKCYGGIFKLRCKNGFFKVMEWYYYNESATEQIYIVGSEISFIFRLEEELKEIENKLKEEVYKSKFISNISHEFRTPINIILSTIQLLELYEGDNKSGERYRYLTTVKNNGYRLLRLINNLIDLNNIESGKIKLNKVIINIVSLVEDIVNSIVDYVGRMKRNIIFDTDEEEVFLSVDIKRIEKVILNLISNAIKFTDEGGNIEVYIETDWKESRVYIYVKDDGVGIPQKDIKTIFNIFNQVDSTFSRRAEGSGIGLCLIKAFVEMHGGGILLKSKLGVGSRFGFYLPIDQIRPKEIVYNTENTWDSAFKSAEIEFSDIYDI
ncbi:MAG: PAS domain S-box protein [Clostridium sp.]|uniref:ATP-binding protein n=1 Tax=Clostridium sp. TaxID=1506 RepID=UPI0025B8B1AF|nr:ATP-binding protein [Clostridium sp.]MBS5927503.1 PAS domain S-box protein [Clostridium sp.]